MSRASLIKEVIQPAQFTKVPHKYHTSTSTSTSTSASTSITQVSHKYKYHTHTTTGRMREAPATDLALSSPQFTHLGRSGGHSIRHPSPHHALHFSPRTSRTRELPPRMLGTTCSCKTPGIAATALNRWAWVACIPCFRPPCLLHVCFHAWGYVSPMFGYVWRRVTWSVAPRLLPRVELRFHLESWATQSIVVTSQPAQPAPG